MDFPDPGAPYIHNNGVLLSCDDTPSQLEKTGWSRIHSPVFGVRLRRSRKRSSDDSTGASHLTMCCLSAVNSEIGGRFMMMMKR